MLYHNAPGSVDYTIVGSPTIVDGVASGFTTSNYLKTPEFSPGSSPWEIVCKFSTKDLNAAGGIITGLGSSDSVAPFYINQYNTNKLIAYLSSNGSSWDLANAINILTVESNTTYKLKAEFTGTSYNWYKWENNAWTLLQTVVSSTPIYGTIPLVIGNNRGNNFGFKGSIDLNETYITVNGQPWFGLCPVEVQKHQLKGPVGYTIVGSPTITNGVVSNLSIDDYLRLDSSFSADSSWEIISRVKPDSISATKYFMAGQSRSIAIGTTNSPIGYLKAFFSSNGTSWNIGNIVGTEKLTSSNTWYYVKVGYDGKQYYLEHSTDGITYKGRATIESSLRIKTDDILIGKTGLFTSYYWGGEVDLNETYIFKQGKLWYWQPRETERIVVNGVEVWSKPQES